jgi:hypothetical protein
MLVRNESESVSGMGRNTQFRYSQDYFFPDDEIDNTYRQLRERDIDAKMSQLEKDNDLVENSLGRVALYAAKEKI